MKCAVFVVLAALLCLKLCSCQLPVPVPVPVPKGLTNPKDLIKLAALFGCRLIGLDGGIDKEFARTMLGFGNPFKMQRCMVGCVIGWIYSSNQFMQWEFGINMAPKLPGKMLGSIQGTFSGCIGGALNSGKKCEIVQELFKCFINTEKSKMISKFKSTFMPWLPCWDYLKTKIPVVRTIDKAAHVLSDSFIQSIEKGIGNFFRPNKTAENPDLSSPLTTESPIFGPPEKPGTQRPVEPITNEPEEPVTEPPPAPPEPEPAAEEPVQPEVQPPPEPEQPQTAPPLPPPEPEAEEPVQPETQPPPAATSKT